MRRHPLAPAALVAALALAACSSDAPQTKRELPPQTVTAAIARSQTMAGGLTASGRLVPREEVAVAADLNGFRVARVLVEEGDYVRRGQLLAQLDDSLLRAQIDQVRASLGQQQVAAEQAAAQASRVAGLEGEGVLSGEAIDNRKFAVRSSRASAAATRAQLDDLLVRRSHLQIRAPSDGLVLERTVRPGDTSSTGATMFRLARGRLIELHAELAEADAAKIALGEPAAVRLPSGRELTGQVRLMGARVDGQTGLTIARIALPRDRELRQGGFAEARFVRDVQAVAVPEAAVQFDADGASVKLIDGERRIRRVPVRTGRRGGGLVEIVSGLAEGSRVAVKGGAFALNGDKVRIVSAREI